MSLAASATTILLIDDHDTDRTYYAEKIRTGIHDCRVLEAWDGQSGLDLYRSRRIDCIISELYLPDMSGYELLHEVVPRMGQPEIPIILLASIARMGLADMAKAHGAQALLWKHTGNELIPVIRRAIAQ